MYYIALLFGAYLTSFFYGKTKTVLKLNTLPYLVRRILLIQYVVLLVATHI